MTGKTYIGFDSRWPGRKASHKCSASKCKDNFLFHNAIRKYGFENFTWEVLCECEDLSLTLNELEPFYIKLFGSFGKHGYNLTVGGDGIHGLAHSEETKRKISENNKANPRRYWLGKKRYEETNKKISITKQGKRQSNYRLTEEDVRKIREDNREYREIAIDYDIHTSHVSNIKTFKKWKHI